MCPAPSGGTYEAASGPGKGGEPKPAGGLGKTQRAQEAPSPLTADLECVLPPPMSPTRRPLHRGPEALGRGRWGSLGSTLDQKPGSWRCSGVKTQTYESRWGRKHAPASDPICHPAAPHPGLHLRAMPGGKGPISEGDRPSGLPVPLGTSTARRAWRRAWLSELLEGHPVAGGEKVQVARRWGWEAWAFGLRILSGEPSGVHLGLGPGETPASRSPSQGRRPRPFQAG